MNCEEFQSGLETAVENRVDPDYADAREHLKQCAHCRALCEDYHMIERAVQEWAAVEDAPDLSGRVLAVLAEDRKPNRLEKPVPSPARMVPMLVGLSMVALVFLAFYLTQGPEPNPEQLAGDQLPDNSLVNTPPVIDAVEVETVEMEHVIGDTKAAYASLVQQVTAPFEPLKSPDPPPLTEDQHSPPAENDTETPVTFVPNQLEELQSEFRKSLGFLTAAFPPQSPAP